ncbi:hypothetical protein OAE67_00415, partial [bacterium]|nr:hypothetical protein [bacterium]
GVSANRSHAPDAAFGGWFRCGVGSDRRVHILSQAEHPDWTVHGAGRERGVCGGVLWRAKAWGDDPLVAACVTFKTGAAGEHTQGAVSGFGTPGC